MGDWNDVEKVSDQKQSKQSIFKTNMNFKLEKANKTLTWFTLFSKYVKNFCLIKFNYANITIPAIIIVPLTRIPNIYVLFQKEIY